ncbi:hypothetical protein Golomagni_08387 [Golovinomyces magnicellulatus]|nr:hypothetical protein Golomagni_08387 [Golovinomyces magnicellulatus]
MSMSNLASVLSAQGKNGEAEKMNRQTLEAKTKMLGAEHPSTLTSMSNLALTLQSDLSIYLVISTAQLSRLHLLRPQQQHDL